MLSIVRSARIDKTNAKIMKITCDACGSKYSIADDKVRGRKVKVRCKNCKANILVDGTALEEGSSDGGDAGDIGNADSDHPAAANQWTVNLTDEDSRDMTSEEIVEGWKAGIVTEDAYVWRDGMTAWKPILEVAELKVKLLATGTLSPKTAAVSAGPALPLATKTSPQAGLQTTPLASPAKADAPAGDLFGSWGKETPFGAGTDEGKKPTGARNENSVLFSLDALKGTAEKPAAPAKKSSPDDLFAMGTMPGGGLLTANVDLLTAPALEPPPAPASRRGEAVAGKRGGGLMFGLIAVAALALGGGYFAFKDKLGDAGEQASEAEQKAREAQAKAAEAEAKAREAEAQKKELEEALAKARAEATAKGEDPSAAEKKVKEAQAAAAAEAAAPAAGATKEPAAPTTTTTTSPAPAKTSTTASASTSSSSSGGGKAFDVAAAKAALSAAAANAAACGQPGGPTGPGKVQLTFAPSGRVTTATVIEGPFGGTAVGGCVSSTFKRARVPAFDGAPQTVTKAFKIN